MLYISTRGKTDMVSSAHAISNGLAADGGLFVPKEFPPISWLKSMPCGKHPTVPGTDGTGPFSDGLQRR